MDRSGSVSYSEVEVMQSLAPTRGLSNVLDQIHLAQVGSSPSNSLQLAIDDVFASHGMSGWSGLHEFPDLWDNLPLYSQELAPTTLSRVGWGEGSSSSHSNEHQIADRVSSELERSQGGRGKESRGDAERSLAASDDHRPEALLQAVPCILASKARDSESPFISNSPSHNPTPRIQSAAVPLVTSISPPTPLSASLSTGNTRITATREAGNTCAVASSAGLEQSSIHIVPSKAARKRKVIPPRIPPDVLKAVQPGEPREEADRTPERGRKVNLENEQAQAKPSSTKHRKGLVVDHVERERQRRQAMACKLATLEVLLPAANSKRDRVAILEDTVQCIKSLQQEVQVLRERYKILAAKRTTGPSRGPVIAVSTSSRLPNLRNSGEPFSKPRIKSVCAYTKPKCTPPLLSTSEICRQPDPFALPLAKYLKGPSIHNSKNVFVEFHMQLDNKFEQAVEVVKCQCRLNYLSSTMRTVEDLQLDVCRCSVTKLPQYIICVLVLKTRSNALETETATTTQLAARLRYNQSLNFDSSKKQ